MIMSNFKAKQYTDLWRIADFWNLADQDWNVEQVEECFS